MIIRLEVATAANCNCLIIDFEYCITN